MYNKKGKQSIIKRIYTSILQAIYPKGITCINCGREIDEEDSYFSLCDECIMALPYTNGEGCPVCGSKLDGKDKKCNNCSSTKHYYDKIYSVFWYKSMIKHMVVSYKDKGATYYGEYMAKYFYYLIKTEGIKADCIAYVPTSFRVRRLRGFDPIQRIAKFLSEYINIPYYNVLTRKNKTRDQTKKSKAERLAQIVGQYSVYKDCIQSCILGKKVLLIDDIVTTTATADECSKILKNLGASEVIVLSFARA